MNNIGLKWWQNVGHRVKICWMKTFILLCFYSLYFLIKCSVKKITKISIDSISIIYEHLFTYNIYIYHL